MKLTKLMLSAFAAAMTLIACNKENATPEVNTELRSVEISLENVIFTKANGGDPVTAEKVQVNDFQIILTDDAGTPYTGKTAEGEDAQSYWAPADLASGMPTKVSYHYVDHRCTRVVVVANLGAKVANVEEAQETISLNQQLDVDNLPLWGDDTQLEPLTTHTHDGTQIFKASLTLKPMIARFEIDGFRVNFVDPANPKYGVITVEEVGFTHFYNQAVLGGTYVPDSFSSIQNFEDEIEVYNWFDSERDDNDMWNIDDFAPALSLTPTDNAADNPYLVAYHFYPSNHIPYLLIRLTADSVPAYLYTANYSHSVPNSSGGTDQVLMTAADFKPGYVYRMSAEGMSPGSDGFIEFDDEDIEPMQRCIDVEVEVHEWVVELITPEF